MVTTLLKLGSVSSGKYLHKTQSQPLCWRCSVPRIRNDRDLAQELQKSAKNIGCLIVHRKLLHRVAIWATSFTRINDTALAFSILTEVYAEDWMDHVGHNHAMGTRLAGEDETPISATEDAKALSV